VRKFNEAWADWMASFMNFTPSSDTYPHKNSLVCNLAEFLKKYLGEID
jgi:hypothetical protein